VIAEMTFPILAAQYPRSAAIEHLAKSAFFLRGRLSLDQPCGRRYKCGAKARRSSDRLMVLMM
jgi:hypothetical protein